jgi:hypothetical protein
MVSNLSFMQIMTCKILPIEAKQNVLFFYLTITCLFSLKFIFLTNIPILGVSFCDTILGIITLL